MVFRAVKRPRPGFSPGPPSRGKERSLSQFRCTAWNSSLIFMPSARQMRYSVSIDAEFLPSSICDR